MVNTRAWKKMTGLVECDKFRLCGEDRETVNNLFPVCKRLVATERFNNTFKVLAVIWAVENGLLPEDTKCYAMNWERGKVIKKD